MPQAKMKFAVRQGNRTIALFWRLRDARQLISEINWEEGKINLQIVRLQD